MKSELAQLNTQKKSLMHMLARDEDFVHPLTSPDNSGACSLHSETATSKLIKDHMEKSVTAKHREVGYLSFDLMVKRTWGDCDIESFKFISRISHCIASEIRIA